MAKPRNPHFSPPFVRCRPRTVSPGLSIIKPPSTRPVLDHPRSSTPGLLLLPRFSSVPVMLHLSPAQHKTKKHDSPHEQNNRVEPPKSLEFKFKPRQVNYSSQSNQGTDYLVSQSPPWWVYWQHKSTKFKFWIQDTWSTARRIKDNKKLKMVV
jgi:hypothetical protein